MDEFNDLEFSVSVLTRPYIPELDAPFLFSTWRKSAFYGLPKEERPDAEEFFKDLTIEIKRTLKHAKVKIACTDNDTSYIVGYVVTTGNHLDWVYVRDKYRNKGIASLIVPKDIKTFTDRPTKIGKAILSKKNQGE